MPDLAETFPEKVQELLLEIGRFRPELAMTLDGPVDPDISKEEMVALQKDMLKTYIQAIQILVEEGRTKWPENLNHNPDELSAEEIEEQLDIASEVIANLSGIKMED